MPRKVKVEKSAADATIPGRKVRRSITINDVESPLGWLHRHGHLSVRQYEAGEQLRSDWERANLSPRVTMRWDPVPIRSGSARDGSHGATDQQMGAKQRFDGALAASGSGMSDILWRIVCAGEGMREAETALGWPARAGKVVLGLALDRVADFYRMK